MQVHASWCRGLFIYVWGAFNIVCSTIIHKIGDTRSVCVLRLVKDVAKIGTPVIYITYYILRHVLTFWPCLSVTVAYFLPSNIVQAIGSVSSARFLIWRRKLIYKLVTKTTEIIRSSVQWMPDNKTAIWTNGKYPWCM